MKKNIAILFMLFVSFFAFGQDWQFETNQDMMSGEEIEVMYLQANAVQNGNSPFSNPLIVVAKQPNGNINPYIEWGGRLVKQGTGQLQARLGDSNHNFAVLISDDREATFLADVQRIVKLFGEHDQAVFQMVRPNGERVVARWDVSDFSEAFQRLTEN